MKRCLFLFAVALTLSCLTVACSNESEDSEKSDSADVHIEKDMAEDSGGFAAKTDEMESVQSEDDDHLQEEGTASKKSEINEINRKVIYTADLRIEVKDYQKTVNKIQTEVSNRSGYIVDSNMYKDEDDRSIKGHVTARIPQDKFREFIQLVEESSSKVLESSISGQDVTEEYVDLESRLKSKKVVEKRLLSFMEQAKKTEDLLAISNDLADVQEIIEEITGRMKYLQNKADLATVTIDIHENNLTISGMNDKDLNTWEQTKQQFMKSINFLLSSLSSVVVFLFGNLPVLILCGIIGLITFIIVKKSKKRSEKSK